MNARCSTRIVDHRFMLLGPLGRGAMATVYRALDRPTGRVVALKVPSPAECRVRPQALAEEFDVWSRMNHPHIVGAHELKTARRGAFEPGTPYLVLEHVEGQPLHRAGSAPLGPTELCALAQQLLSALAHVHSRGFVHRDVKPANVLRREGRKAEVKLTDFGLAAPLDRRRRAGSFSGCLLYAAPEALLGRPVDARSDLYSLGLVLYRLGAGKLPMGSPRAEEVVRWHLDGPTLDLPAGACGAAGLGRLIHRLSAREPGERPRSAAAALLMLRQGREGGRRRAERLSLRTAPGPPGAWPTPPR
jgi:serine/threonine-protein kinase